ncbi:unnamed protein product [Phytomonas sp. EM1]|nr:unnamed protein product [Phytomonas sp. EM1]|eukprot:CCW60586.1 unnamed protein product [Phytomonas sp. isolate EM1]
MSLSVCVCKPGAYDPTFQKLFDPLLNKVKRIVFGEKVIDFADVKKGNEAIALFVEAAISRDVIKDLCDDYGLKDRRVKFIYSSTVGVDIYNFHEMKREIANINVYNGRGCYTVALKEHVLFSVLYFNRQCWRMNQSKALKKWDRYNMILLGGQKLVIVGYGEIGQSCGKAAAALGMDVIGIRKTPPTREFDENGVRLMPLSAVGEAIADADVVLAVLPLTEESRGYFNQAFFRQMKPSAIFINIGRGSTHCEKDLVEALQQGVIRGAALDVFEVEPLPQTSPLWEMPDDKLLLTSHCADFYEEMDQVYVDRFIKITEAFLQNQPINEYLVDVNRSY